MALYLLEDEPQHMARQLKDGSWTSKCGGNEDITHFTLDALESDDLYGSPMLYMKRLRMIGWVVESVQAVIWKFTKWREARSEG